MSCTSCAKGADGKPAGCKSNGYCSTSGCNKLDVFDFLAGIPLPGGVPVFDAVEVRFKGTRKAFYRNMGHARLQSGDLVTVEAAAGHDVGVVTLAGELVRAQMQRKTGNTDTYGLRKVLRKSTQDEVDAWQRVRKLEDETLMEARKAGNAANLDIKVSDVEYQGDGTRATFYYTSEHRVELKGLVRELSSRFPVRVDMKQIGARQEAGRIGGIGPCGRELCCSTWLTDLRSVSTSAARYQQLALNPQKLSGLCGKLKCCLNFELDMYIEAIKSYPSQNAKLKTKQGTGVHMKTDIFTEKMWYLFKVPGQSSAMAGFPIETVREILAQNKEGVLPEVDLHMADEPVAVQAAVQRTDYGNVIDGAEDLSRFDRKGAGRNRKRGRDTKRKQAHGQPGKEDGKQHTGDPAPKSANPAGKPKDGRKSRDLRGRRRKGPRPDGPASGNAPKPDNA